MGRMIEMTGKKFSRLQVVRLDGLLESGECVWLCQCDCGKWTTVPGRYLRAEKVKSCGCLRKDVARARMVVYHGKLKNEQREQCSVRASAEPSGLLHKPENAELCCGAGGIDKDHSQHHEDSVRSSEDGKVPGRDKALAVCGST